MTAVGQLLRRRREDLGATLQEAAPWCGTSAAELAQLEAAKDLSSTTFERVCQGLAVSPSELLSGVERSPRRSAGGIGDLGGASPRASGVEVTPPGPPRRTGPDAAGRLWRPSLRLPEPLLLAPSRLAWRVPQGKCCTPT
ncbi:MAG: helix-turn-helix domain-containing protein [Candidatus Latescibacterota bacterium]